MQDDKPDYTLWDILNEIRTSRGTLKNKYSKVPKVRMAEPEELTPEQLRIINDHLKKGEVYLFLVDEDSSRPEISATLTSKQQDIISLLTNTHNNREDYFDDIKNAVRARLIWHPLVHEFVYSYKALGNKEILRKIKRGWETGVGRPLTLNDLRFANHLEEIAKYREEGKTWPQIRRNLMKRKIIVKMSWQALQKKFNKAWEEKWKKVNKKAPPIS